MGRKKTNQARSKRGFTLVECIICIVIISAISLAALAAVMATTDIIQRADDRNKATDRVEAIMACYRTDNFPQALALCGIEGYDGNGNFTVYYDKDFQVIGLTQPTDNNYHCRIEVTVGQNSIGVKAIGRASGEVYYKTEEWLG